MVCPHYVPTFRRRSLLLHVHIDDAAAEGSEVDAGVRAVVKIYIKEERLELTSYLWTLALRLFSFYQMKTRNAPR